MPLYEFKCIKCENEFEDLLFINEANPKCPECNSETQKKISISLGIVPGSSNRTIDCKVGHDAEKKWDMYRNKKEKREKGVV